MDRPQKPVPTVSPWTVPFWKGCNEGRLLIQKCRDCHKYIFYPRLYCPHCMSENTEYVEASGKGTVYSFTIVLNNAPSAFLADMPFVIAIVRLEEGVQMLTNLVECNHDDIRCDMPVQAVFEKLNEEFTLPKFKPSL